MGEGRLADPLASAERAGFQGRVGLVDDLQPLLGSLVAAMSIGVVLLDEDLIPRFEPHHGKRRLDVEHRERLVAGRCGSGGSFRTMPVRPAIAAPPALVMRLAVVEAERIAHPFAMSRAVALAELPSRALPHRVVADLGLDLCLAHPGIVVPGGVVGAHMLEAEPVVALQFETRFGRAELAAGRAAGTVAPA